MCDWVSGGEFESQKALLEIAVQVGSAIYFFMSEENIRKIRDRGIWF